MNRAFRLLTLGLMAAVGASASAADTAAAVGQWRAGTNYTPLQPAQPTSAGPGQVEVIEVFWYGCGHCYALDPALENWRNTKAKYIDFRRVPVVWGPPHRQHAKLFYTLQALGRDDLHPKVFDAIHREGKMLATNDDDAAARAMHLAFLKDHGVPEKDFNAAYDSAEVAENLQRAEEATTRFAVSSVPLIIVNGKYTTSPAMAGGTPASLLSLIDELAASERPR
jgi:protein dithiol oxidoreductase (disulfide-forming)